MVLFAIVLLVAGLGGYAVLRAVGLDVEDAWAGGRTAGLVAAALPAWWAGCLGFSRWLAVALGVGAVLGVAGGMRLWRDGAPWRRLAGAEAGFWTGALVLLWIRLPRPAIVDTEKLMDLGIFSTLLRATDFPPPDMWLAGHTLPYYYWGALAWIPALKAARVELDIGYNLIVAAIGGLLVALAWRIGTRLAGSAWAGALAAFLAVFAGTAAGWLQLLSGGGIDLWASSRTIPDTITEFPLFTAWLGDLHPHFLSMPLALLAILLALPGSFRRTGAGLAAVAVAFGVTWAANPWAMPVTLAAVSALLIPRDGRWRWPWQEGGRWWLAVGAVAIGGWLVTAPFQLAFHPPFQGLGLVHAWTAVDRLLLWGGVLLVPVVGAAAMELGRSLGGGEDRRRALTLAVAALLVLASAISGRPVTVLLAAILLLLASAALGPEESPDRPALLLATIGILLLLVPEILYVRDPYGGKLHRMNTVFKAYIQAWPLLALAFPVLMRRWLPRLRVRAMVTAALVMLALPQTGWVLEAPLLTKPWGLDGLAWMSGGDRAAVRFLRRQPPGTVLAEAPGGAYSHEARLSAASGVPAVLGWENHERVWRGTAIIPEIDRRKAALDALYQSGRKETVERVAREFGIDLVAVGPLERERYPGQGLEAVLRAGPHVLEGDTTLVRVSRGRPATGEALPSGVARHPGARFEHGVVVSWPRAHTGRHLHALATKVGDECGLVRVGRAR